MKETRFRKLIDDTDKANGTSIGKQLRAVYFGENVGDFAEGFDAETLCPCLFATGLSIGVSVACAQRQP
jgi:hypothetical protein